jgi:hypothetical protein
MGASSALDIVLACKACVSKAGLCPDDLYRMTRAGRKCGNCNKPMEAGEGQPWLVKDLPIVAKSSNTTD